MSGRRTQVLAMAAALACTSAAASAQLCTTQSRLQPALRDSLALTSLELGSAVKAGNVTAVRAATMASLAANFGATEGLVKGTAAQISGDTLEVEQLYVLDASARNANESGPADFTCPLADAAGSETDFSISGLPAGKFAFAMVEAHGPHPWLLAFLLQQEGSGWKMAGFYPHPRTAGGHDGLWYWRDARTKVAAKQPWLAWLEYGEADALLRPATFVSSTNLDSLRAEQHASAPPGLTEGISADSPVLVKTPDGKDLHVTQMNADAVDGDGPLRLAIHVAVAAGTDAQAMREWGTIAAKGLLTEHPALRSAFTGMLVFVEVPNGSPVVLSLPMDQVK